MAFAGEYQGFGFSLKKLTKKLKKVVAKPLKVIAKLPGGKLALKPLAIAPGEPGKLIKQIVAPKPAAPPPAPAPTAAPTAPGQELVDVVYDDGRVVRMTRAEYDKMVADAQAAATQAAAVSQVQAPAPVQPPPAWATQYISRPAPTPLPPEAGDIYEQQLFPTEAPVPSEKTGAPAPLEAGMTKNLLYIGAAGALLYVLTRSKKPKR